MTGNPEKTFQNSSPLALDESSLDTSYTEDDSHYRINLKRIKEITKRKTCFQIPDIRTLNLDTRNSCTQTLVDDSKVISQFRIEKEKFQDLLSKEVENNSKLCKTLDEFKSKTKELERFCLEIEKKLENSTNSENIHVKQAQELSNKCIKYSNQLISVNSRVNELNQELKESRNIIIEYKEALKLYNVEKGDLREIILSEREEKDSEIKMLNERINKIIQLYQMESSFTPNLQMEDKMLIQKLQDKILTLKEEADKERNQSVCNLDQCENLKLDLDNLKKRYTNDKREMKKLHEKIEMNKDEIALYQTKNSDLQGILLKKEQELYLLDQKFKNLTGQIHAKDLIIKDQNKKYEGICVELENFKLKYGSLSQRHTNSVTLKKDLARKDDLLKTFKSKIDTLHKDLSEARSMSHESLKIQTRKITARESKKSDANQLESERKYSQVVNVLAALLVKVQPSLHEWKSNEKLRNRMTSISTKYLGKDLNSLMNCPDYPSQLLDILSQDQFETDLHAFLGDILCGE